MANRSKIAKRVSRRGKLSRKRLDELVAEATVDCYGESELATGWLTVIEDGLRVPFQTRFLGVDVTVKRVDSERDGAIVALCAREGEEQAVPILGLPLPSPAPKGAEWIEAYRYWSLNCDYERWLTGRK